MSIDFHTHTHFSDGVVSPTGVVALARAAGVRGVAITDHDTMAGWDEAAEACRAQDLLFVPGIELSTEESERSIHLLGYFVDRDHPRLAAECARLRGERLRRARAVVDRLAACGVEVAFEAVLKQANGAPIGRPHIAAAMVAAGAVPDVQAAFDCFIADGGPAYEPKRALDPQSGARLLAEAGGVAVLAHPGLRECEAHADVELLDRLVEAGLAGVEAEHASHEEEEIARWRELAAERELLVTGSSDFHGGEKPVKIGARTTSVSTWERLRERAAGRSQPW